MIARNLLPALLLVLSALEASAQHRHMGVATCASSNCHGAAAPVKNSTVLQNEFVTWYRHDKHAQAYTTLTNERSRAMARNLNIAAPEKEPLCLSCHTTYVPNGADRSEKYRIEDGVGCESCHGAASGWLKGHVQTNASHAQNVKDGMRELSDIKIRTELCITCHLGDNEKHVNHKIMGAGHPRLTFEIDTFTAVEPPHWKLTKAYQQRKGTYDSAQVWLVGQSVQGAARLNALLSPHRSQSGIFPEFTTMNCYSCHHTLKDEQYRTRDYGGRPGEARLNLAELEVLSTALTVIDAGLATELKQRTEKLTSGFGRMDITVFAREAVAFLERSITPRLRTVTLNDEDKEKIVERLLQLRSKSLYYETAEQLAMGVAAVAASTESNPETKQTIRKLYESLRDPNTFDPRLFGVVRSRK